MTEKHQCATRIYHPSGNWHYFTDCKWPGKVEVDGKWFCGIHSPEGEKKRKNRLNAKYDADAKKRSLKYNIEAARAEVVNAAIAVVYDLDLPDDHLLRIAVSRLETLNAQRD